LFNGSNEEEMMKGRANLGAAVLAVVFLTLVMLFAYMPALAQTEATPTCTLGTALPLVALALRLVL